MLPNTQLTIVLHIEFEYGIFCGGLTSLRINGNILQCYNDRLGSLGFLYFLNGLWGASVDVTSAVSAAQKYANFHTTNLGDGERQTGFHIFHLKADTIVRILKV